MGLSVRERGIYCHTVPGRMRLKQPCWKGATARLGRTAQAVRQLPGVTDAVANATTGSLLILFDPGQTQAEALIAFLKERGEISSRTDLLVSPGSRPAASRAQSGVGAERREPLHRSKRADRHPLAALAGTRLRHPLATLAWSAGSALGKEILKGALGHALRDTPWSILLTVV